MNKMMQHITVLLIKGKKYFKGLQTYQINFRLIESINKLLTIVSTSHLDSDCRIKLITFCNITLHSLGFCLEHIYIKT